MYISIIIKKYIVQKCKDRTKSKETKNSTVCFGSNPLYLVQTSHNLNACNVYVHAEDTQVLHAKFCNVHAKPHQCMCSQNVQQLITKHMCT